MTRLWRMFKAVLFVVLLTVIFRGTATGSVGLFLAANESRIRPLSAITTDLPWQKFLAADRPSHRQARVVALMLNAPAPRVDFSDVMACLRELRLAGQSATVAVPTNTPRSVLTQFFKRGVNVAYLTSDVRAEGTLRPFGSGVDASGAVHAFIPLGSAFGLRAPPLRVVSASLWSRNRLSSGVGRVPIVAFSVRSGSAEPLKRLLQEALRQGISFVSIRAATLQGGT